MKATERALSAESRRRGWNLDHGAEVWEVLPEVSDSYDSLTDLFEDFGVADPREAVAV